VGLPGCFLGEPTPSILPTLPVELRRGMILLYKKPPLHPRGFFLIHAENIFSRHVLDHVTPDIPITCTGMQQAPKPPDLLRCLDLDLTSGVTINRL
jgi:hypothetical protein